MFLCLPVGLMIFIQLSLFPSAFISAKVSAAFFVVFSMPAIVGKDGIETQVPISLSREEEEKLRESADTLKKVIAGLGI